jgi:hypothetical protein
MIGPSLTIGVSLYKRDLLLLDALVELARSRGSKMTRSKLLRLALRSVNVGEL